VFWVIDYLLLALIVAAALIVVRVVNLSAAVMALSAMGVFLSLLFVVLGAPDDAHAEIVVGAIALPTFYLIALGKIRTAVADEPELGEPAGSGESAGRESTEDGSG
jgi:energy-converting hydrogenase B subunit D